MTDSHEHNSGRGNCVQVYLNALGVINALGNDKASIYQNLLTGQSPAMVNVPSHLQGKSSFVGVVNTTLPALPDTLSVFDCKNNRLSLAALQQIAPAIDAAKDRYGAGRLGVVMGTSTSGVDDMERALWQLTRHGSVPEHSAYVRQEIGSTAEFVARLTRIHGPAYALSSACSSSGKVLASARGLIQSGLCDAVLVGGADSLCELTLNGFSSLEALSPVRTNPFSLHRSGINIGEGAAIFLMSREPVGPAVHGIGESSDAHHMASPDPTGAGARRAMQAALTEADLGPGDIQYLNLHGTGTAANDLMESHAVYDVFGPEVLCSSTKPLTGHTLGAAGATEAALCWLLLDGKDNHAVAPHVFDGERDPSLSPISLCVKASAAQEIIHIMSNSFAFGGSNVSVILGRNDNH